MDEHSLGPFFVFFLCDKIKLKDIGVEAWVKREKLFKKVHSTRVLPDVERRMNAEKNLKKTQIFLLEARRKLEDFPKRT